jgi:anti-anti-sigma factor
MTEAATATFEEQDGLIVAHLQGEIDLSNADDLSGTIARSVPNAAIGLILNLSEVTYLDSAGIRLLFELARRLRERGQRLSLVVPDQTPLRRVLQLTNVAAMMPLCGTVERARSQILSPER